MIEARAIMQCLSEIDELLSAGLAQEGSSAAKAPDMMFVDSNYFTDAVIQWTTQISDGLGVNERRWMPIVGRGLSAFEQRKFIQPTKTGAEVRKIGDGWYLSYERARGAWRVTVDADKGKLAVQDSLRVDAGLAGSMTLPMAPQREHAKVSQHLASEVRQIVNDPLKGPVEKWLKSGGNHLLDCAAYAYTAAKYMGWKPLDAPNGEPMEAINQPAREIKQIEPKQPKQSKPKAESWFSKQVIQ